MYSEEKKEQAEKVINELYDKLKVQDYKSCINLFSDGFLKNKGEDFIVNSFSGIQDKIGKLSEVRLVNWKSEILVGTNPSKKYFFSYTNNYEGCKTLEKFMLLEDNGDIKIAAYGIDSDCLN